MKTVKNLLSLILIPFIFYNASGQYSGTKMESPLNVKNFKSIVTWTGNVSDDWLDPANWLNNSIPHETDDVIVPDVSPNPFPVIYGGDGFAHDLTVHSNATILILPSGTLSVLGLTTVEADGLIHITSDNTGAAGSFINVGNLTGDGNFQYDRYLVPEDMVDPQTGWHFISPPINNAVSGDFVGYTVKRWDAATSLYYDLDPCFDCCFLPSQFDIPIVPMQGYSVRLDYSYECLCESTFEMIEFGGDHQHTHNCTANQGCTPLNLATQKAAMANVNTGDFFANVNWLGTGTYSQWNMIGNPYSSAIRAAGLTKIFPPQVNASVHYWDNVNRTYQVWSSGIGAAKIPATQGFMVEVNTPGWSGNLAINNSMRGHCGADHFYKSEVDNLLTIRATGNNVHDDTYICFLEEASTAFDRDYDAHKLFSQAAGSPQVYTSSGSELLAINVQPATEIVPLGFISASSGQYSLEAIETSDFQTILLEDKELGLVTNLLSDLYSFDYKTGDDPDRFDVHFASLATEQGNDGFLIYQKDNNLVLYNLEKKKGNIFVYDLAGRLIQSCPLLESCNLLYISEASGCYLVSVKTSANTVNQKVYFRNH